MSTETVDRRGGQPESDRVWSIESHGINPISDSDGHAHERAIGPRAGFPPHVTITRVDEEPAARRGPAVT